MVPLEMAHYNVWAERFEAALQVACPRTFWMVLQHVERGDGGPWCFDLPWDGDLVLAFRLIAVTLGSGRYIWKDVPFSLVVDEEAFALVVVALGWELERRLAVLVGEERGGAGGD